MTDGDARWTELAVMLANAHNIGPGTRVGIFHTDASTHDAVAAFVAEIYLRGGLPQVIDANERFDRMAVSRAADEVLRSPAPLELWSMEWADVHVSFRGMVAPSAEAVDDSRLAMQRKAKGVISTARWQQTSWALVRIPTPEWADLIGASFPALMEEFFAGTLADWPSLTADWTALCRRLERASTVQIIAPDTDLRLGVLGRSWVPFAGEANLPDGEVATAPVDDLVEGHITFPGSFWFAGAEVADLRLEFSAGLVTSVDASTGAGLVSKLLETDLGARRVGELGIGTNPAVRTMTGDLLIDEKILGTVHIALGRAYPECGGVNESSLHWDIVKDLRGVKGSLLVDDVPLIDRGIPVGALAPNAPTQTGSPEQSSRRR